MVATIDVAILYNYDTKRINEIVKRNIDRFPDDFCFRLTEIEYNLVLNLKSQFATSNCKKGGRRNLPYVFTEHGIMMLAGMLKSDTAIEVSKRIIYAFVSMRKFINENKDIFKRLTVTEYKLLEHDDKIDNYIDKSVLDMLIYKKESVNVELIASSHYLTKQDINKFNFNIQI